jgi:hypothetical protein
MVDWSVPETAEHNAVFSELLSVAGNQFKRKFLLDVGPSQGSITLINIPDA